ncbi:hypothetical protein EV128_12568 [Rhizobium azibense]|nr:hypothetical protein EV128_12568 [Rhizobium azibense]
MKINFPASGAVLYAGGSGVPKHFVSAPLHAYFYLNPYELVGIGQNHTIVDDAGTSLTYRLTALTLRQDEFATGEGELVAVTHVEPNVIPYPEHLEKVSASIDAAFEAGRQVGREEQQEVEADDEDVELINPLYKAEDWTNKSEQAACACDFCEATRQGDLATGGEAKPDSVVGERAGEAVLPTINISVNGEAPTDISTFVRNAVAEALGANVSNPFLGELPFTPTKSRLFRYGPVGNRIDD